METGEIERQIVFEWRDGKRNHTVEFVAQRCWMHRARILRAHRLHRFQFDSHAAEPTTSRRSAKAPKSARPQCRTCREFDVRSNLLSFSHAMFVVDCISSRRE